MRESEFKGEGFVLNYADIIERYIYIFILCICTRDFGVLC